MFNLKLCPFCFNIANQIYNSKSDCYEILCPNCQSNNIYLNVFDKDKHICAEKWNNLTTKYSKLIDELIKYIDFNKINNSFYTDLLMIQQNDKNENRIGYGCIIDENGKIILCNDSHVVEIAKFYNIDAQLMQSYDKLSDYNTASYLIQKLKRNFIRITTISKIIYIQYDNYNNKQLTSVINFLNDYKHELNYFMLNDDKFFNKTDIINYIFKLMK